MDSTQAFIARAAADPDLMQRFMNDPDGTARAEGLHLTGTTPAALVEELRARVSKMSLGGTILRSSA